MVGQDIGARVYARHEVEEELSSERIVGKVCGFLDAAEHYIYQLGHSKTDAKKVVDDARHFRNKVVKSRLEIELPAELVGYDEKATCTGNVLTDLKRVYLELGKIEGSIGATEYYLPKVDNLSKDEAREFAWEFYKPDLNKWVRKLQRQLSISSNRVVMIVLPDKLAA